MKLTYKNLPLKWNYIIAETKLKFFSINLKLIFKRYTVFNSYFLKSNPTTAIVL